MAIVRHKTTNILYEYKGENKFQNLVTLKEGIVDDEKAREVFVINLEATELLGEYPLIKELIHKIKLKMG
jgi:hypothetical protein